MSVERGVESFVGVMVLLSVALTHFVHPGFIWMTVAIGVNVIQQHRVGALRGIFRVIQQAITGFCPAAMGLRKLGMKTEREIGAQQCG